MRVEAELQRNIKFKINLKKLQEPTKKRYKTYKDNRKYKKAM